MTEKDPRELSRQEQVDRAAADIVRRRERGRESTRSPQQPTPREMTPAERQDWAMRNMPLSDDPAPTGPAAEHAPQPARLAQTEVIAFEPMPDPPDSPYVVIVTGYLVVLIAGAAVGFLAEVEAGGVPLAFAIAVAVAGSIAVSVGTIGAGVRFGMRHSRWEQERERRIEVARQG